MEIDKEKHIRYIFEKNEVIMFSEGAYSDYCCKNIFLVLKTFDIRTIMKNCKCGNYKKRYSWDKNSECKYCYNGEDSNFCVRKLAEAEANGYIKELNYVEIWEDYGYQLNTINEPKPFNHNAISGGSIKERNAENELKEIKNYE